jgi:hypothetical protein
MRPAYWPQAVMVVDAPRNAKLQNTLSRNQFAEQKCLGSNPGNASQPIILCIIIRGGFLQHAKISSWRRGGFSKVCGAP